MQKTITITVLSTLINGRQNFVAMHSASRTWDNKKIVNYTTDPLKAKSFESTEEAMEFVEQIVNPHQRSYTVEHVEVDQSCYDGEQASGLRIAAEEDFI